MREPILKEVREEFQHAPLAEQLLQAITESNEGPGRFLCELRESLGISLEDMASELNLAPKQVVALEENDHDYFPAPIYVRSHLRRYADVVGLPPDPVIEAFQRTGESGPPPLRRVSIRQQISSRNAVVRWATYVFAAGLLVLLIAWWQSNGFPGFPGNSSDEAVTSQENAPEFDLQLPAVDEPAGAVQDGSTAP